MSKRYLFAALLGGMSLAMASALLATSAWLLSMASLRPPILTLEVAVVSVRFFGLGRGALRYLERLVSHEAAFIRLTKARIEIFHKFSQMPYQRLKDFSRGQILQRLTSGIERREDLYLRIIIPWLSGVIAGISGVGILSFLVPPLGLIVGVLFLIMCGLLPALGFLSARFQGKRQEFEETLSKEVVLAIEARDEALVFNYGSNLQSKVSTNLARLKRIDVRESILTAMGNSAVTLFAGSAVVLAIYLSYEEINAGALAAVNFAVAILLPLAIFDSVSTLPSAFAVLGEIVKANDLVASLTNTDSAPTNGTFFITKAPDDFSQLVLEDFRPIRNTSHVNLGKVSTIISRGSRVLLTGQTGTGKTSIALALLGLLEYEGVAQLDGLDLKKLSEENLTDVITLAPQDDYLFATSIRENLKIGNSAVTDKSLRSILEIVELDTFVDSLPERLDTHIGARGVNLSGGEQRRLLLARALLRIRPIVILDEPFEFLDNEQVSRIAPRVFEYLKGSGVLIISHLPVPMVDSIISI